MRDQIIARIKAKFPNINLSKARLDAIADKLKVTEESEIDGKLDELNEIFAFAEIAKQDDRIRGLDKKDPNPTDAPKPDTSKPTEEPTNDDVPAWAKGLVEALPKLVERVGALETGKSTDTRKSKLEEALKDASDSYKAMVLKEFPRIPFKDDEDFNTWMEEKKTDAAQFVQTEANNGLSQNRPPVKSSGPAPKVASKEEVQAIFGKPKS